MKGLPEAWSKESPPAMTNVCRPNSLFQPPPSCTTTTSMTLTSHEAAAANMGQDLKDLYLQDLSDGMLLEIETKCFQSGRENQSVKLIFML